MTGVVDFAAGVMNHMFTTPDYLVFPFSHPYF